MPRLAIIVLAAGRATRFAPGGGHKLLATVDGMPLVRRSVQAALEAALGEVIVVTGCEADAVERALHDLAVCTVRTTGFAEGMAASLRAGIEAVRGKTDAVIISLGDQPFVRPQAYRNVAATWAKGGAAIVVPRYERHDGPAHPVLFAAETYDELRVLRGDVGARQVIAANPARVVTVDLDWPAPRDIDTLDDLASALADLEASRPERAPGAAHSQAAPLHPQRSAHGS